MNADPIGVVATAHWHVRAARLVPLEGVDDVHDLFTTVVTDETTTNGSTRFDADLRGRNRYNHHWP